MIALLALLLLVVVGLVVHDRLRTTPRSLPGDSVIHRCDFCKEAILLIDEDAKTFVQHAGHRALLGYSVINACGACAREHQNDGVFTSDRRHPSA